jgi:hyaluronoglucosaminidase
VRGVIEGFYGPPWSHGARLDAIEFLAALGMNAYVYAPKSDPRHRERWREPYEPHEHDAFGELARACRAVGARFGFALSPGLDVQYDDESDRRAVLRKLMCLRDQRVDWFVLALDDIPSRAGLAEEQANLATWLHHELGHDVRLSLVPTEYVGTRPTAYLSALGSGLPADVDVFWTGPTVCSPVISADDARAWREAVGGLPLLLWDNYPVNDATMEHELHLGPYRGRDPSLSDVLEGVLCNPMLQPRASLVALATAAEFWSDPASYDETDAWERAISEVGKDRREALRAVARACADGPLTSSDTLPAATLVDALEVAMGTPARAQPLAELRTEMRALRAACDAWRDDPDDDLGAELAPWLTQAALEAEAALAALRLLRLIDPIGDSGQSGRGTSDGPDAEEAMLRCFGLLFAWSGARDGRHVVLGPRFSLYPAVVQLADGAPGVDVSLAVREGASVVDRLCRLALDQYRRWVSARSGNATAVPDAPCP